MIFCHAHLRRSFFAHLLGTCFDALREKRRQAGAAELPRIRFLLQGPVGLTTSAPAPAKKRVFDSPYLVKPEMGFWVKLEM